ncbi:MAG: ATP-binding protein [Patescibacteria group bacterium]
MAQKQLLKTLFATFSLCLAFFIFFPIFSASAATQPTVIRVGIYDNRPKIWQDENGTPQGLFPDVLNAIAEKEGWQLQYVFGTWDEGLNRLRTNEIDIMPDVAFSDERHQLYDFNEETVLVSWGMLYTRNGVNMNSILDVEGKRVAIMTNGILYDGPLGLKNMLESFGIQAEIIDVKQYDDVFKMLNEGSADVGVVNRIYGITNEKNYEVRRTSIFFDPTELRFAFTKNSEKNAYLIPTIDKNLHEFKLDNASPYHKSLTRHFEGMIETVEVFPSWFKYLVSIFLLALGLFFGYAVILRTIRTRLEKMIEKRTADLKISEEKYRNIFEKSSDAIMITTDGIVVDINTAMLKMFDCKNNAELLGKSVAQLSPPYQLNGRKSEEFAKELISQASDNGRSFFEWIHRRMNGDDFPAEVLLTPLEFHGQKSIQAVIRDITERKEAEEHVRQLDALKAKFIDIVSHQLRTPLTSVRWGLEELLDAKFGPISQEQLPVIKMIYESSAEVILRIRDLTTAMEIEQGEMRLEKEEVIFEDIARSACISSSQHCLVKKIEHIHDFPDQQTTKIMLDVKLIRDAITRLINNAVAYTPEGGKVTTRIVSGKNNIRFEISDSGIGIPKSEQPRIFDRFFRASNATVMKPDSSGLGLYITKNIIEAHGGKIGLTSEEGKGTTFWFDLPLITAHHK